MRNGESAKAKTRGNVTTTQFDIGLGKSATTTDTSKGELASHEREVSSAKIKANSMQVKKMT